MKTCRRCKETKERAEFNKRRYICRSCQLKEDNNKIAKPHERQIKKAYKVGLKLSKYKKWNDIPVSEAGYYYHLGLKGIKK